MLSARIRAREDATAPGSRWEVVALRSGDSKNRGSTGKIRHYPADKLQGWVHHFEGSPVRLYTYAGAGASHVDGVPDRSLVGNDVGFYRNVRVEEDNGAPAIVADFYVLESSGWLRTFLDDLRANEMLDFVGFSIDSWLREEPGVVNGAARDVVEEILRIESTDIVNHPAAGGRFRRALAAVDPTQGGRMEPLRKLWASLPEPIRQRVTEAEPTKEQIVEQLGAISSGGVGALSEAFPAATGAKEMCEIESGLRAILAAAQQDNPEEVTRVASLLLASYLGYEQAAAAAAKAMEDEAERARAAQAAKESQMGTNATAVTESEKRQAELDKRIRAQERRLALGDLRERLGATVLPQPMRESVIKTAEAIEEPLTDEQIEAMVRAKLTEHEGLVKAGVVKEATVSRESQISMGLTKLDRLLAQLDHATGADKFWTDAEKKRFGGVARESRNPLSAPYIQMSGDPRFTGRRNLEVVEKSDPELAALAREAQVRRSVLGREDEIDSTSFPEALGDSIRRRVAGELSMLPDDWRKIVRTVDAIDYRTMKVVRVGGYDAPPVVLEKGAYQPATSPTDEVAEYAVQKRGHTESLSIEAIRNDDLRVLRAIPEKFARGWNKGLNQFAFNLITSRTTHWNDLDTYDGKKLGHADHGGNLITSALSWQAFWDARKIMRKQTEKDSEIPLGLMPKFLVCSLDLEDVALSIRNSDKVPGVFINDNNSLKGTFEVIANPYAGEGDTDLDNWLLMADPQVEHIIEMAALDGKWTPDIYVQDQPTVGSMFTNDMITYAEKGAYGGKVVNWRGFVLSVVGAD